MQMASMDAGDGSVNKESIFDRKPNTPDVMIEFAQKSATVRLNHEDNSLAWPLDKTKPVKSVYVLPHSESPVVSRDKELYIERKELPATSFIPLRLISSSIGCVSSPDDGSSES